MIFLVKKKKQTNNKAFWGDYFLRIREKTSSSNLKISNVSHKMYFCHLSIIFWIPLFSFSVPIYAPHSHSCPFHPTHRKSLEIGRMCMKLQNPPRVHSLGIYKKTTIDYAEQSRHSYRLSRDIGLRCMKLQNPPRVHSLHNRGDHTIRNSLLGASA